MSGLWNLTNLPADSQAMLLLWSEAAVKGFVLLGMTALLARMLQHASAATRHLVWTVGLVAVLALPLLSSSLPALHTPVVPRAWLSVLQPEPPADEMPVSVSGAEEFTSGSVRSAAITTKSIAEDAGRADVSEAVLGAHAADPSKTSNEPHRMPGEMHPATPAGLLEADEAALPEALADASTNEAASSPAIPWVAWILPFWIVGVVLTAGWFMLQYGSMRWLTRSASRVHEGTTPALVRRLSRDIGLHRNVGVLEGEAQVMPMTWGWLQPVVLLPHDAESWPENRRRDVLTHELAHIKRRDHLTQLLAQIACVLHWFNPLAWYAAHRMSIEREHACDDFVLSAGTRASDYAANLLEIVRSMRRAPVDSMAAIAMAGRSSLRERLTAILDAGRKRERLGLKVTLPAVLLATTVVIPLAALDLAPIEPAFAAEPRVVAPLIDADELRALTAGGLVRLHDGGVEYLSKEELRELREKVEALELRALDLGVFDLEQLEKHGALALDEFDLDGFTLEHLHLAPPTLEDLRLEVPEIEAPDVEADLPVLALNGDFGIKINQINGKWNISLSDGDGRLRIKSRGEIEFNDEGTDVVAISRRGYLDIEEKGDEKTYRLRLRGKRGGEISREWWVDGEKQPYDEEAAEWLAVTLPELSRSTGMNAGPRVQQILDQRGVDGVLDEIEQIDSDYVQRIYFNELQERAELEGEHFRRILETAARELSSDFELASLLISIAEDNRLDQEGQVAYAKASSSIGSDFEQGRSLAALVTRQKLNEKATDAVLSAAASIGSDFELAQLLLKIIEHQEVEKSQAALFDALETVGSDFEQRRVLMTLSQEPKLAADMLSRMLRLAGREMGSDFELASFVVEMAKHHPIEGGTVHDCIAALETVGSDYEYRRAASALVKFARLSEEDLATLVRSAGRSIGSDFELAEFLLQVNDSYDMTGDLREAYLDATESIGSNHENQRVLAALTQKEK